MTCRCGVDHDALGQGQELRDDEEHLGSLPHGAEYLSRGGLRIRSYAPSAVVEGIRSCVQER